MCIVNCTPPPQQKNIKNNKNGIEIFKNGFNDIVFRMLFARTTDNSSFPFNLLLSVFILHCIDSFFKFIFSLAVEAFKDCDNLVLLGNAGNKNSLPVFSFLIYNPQAGRFLHHNFVASLLNDLYGIQARGGCACAGPYAMVCPA